MAKANGPKGTPQTVAVLRALLDSPRGEMYGTEICAEAGLASGTIHPILARLEGLGWLDSRWEDINPQELGRPRRRYYTLSAGGAASAKALVKEADARRAKLHAMRPKLAGGAI
jgi:DNA-binding PadR family transcriptional regulator